MRKIVISLALSGLASALVLFLLLRSEGSGPDARRPDLADEADQEIGDSSSEVETDVVDEARSTPAATVEGEATFDPESGGVLFGLVTDTAGRPLANAEVFVLEDESSRSFFSGGRDQTYRDRFLGKSSLVRLSGPVERVETNREGRYSMKIDSIPVGSYRVLSRHSAHVASARKWRREDRLTSSRLDFELGIGSVISGTVLDPEGTPLAGASITLNRESQSWRDRLRDRGAVERVESGPDGRFQANVSEGTFRLTAQVRGHVETAVRNVEAGTADVAISMPRSKSLEVTVSDPSGRPIAGARLAMFLGDSSWGGRGPPDRVLRLIRKPAARGTTDAKGKYTFSDLANPRYMVLVEGTGRVAEMKSGEIKRDESQGTLAVSLRDAGAISGQVVDAQGSPVAGALVVVAAAGGDERRWGRRPRNEEGQATRSEPLSLWRAQAGVETDGTGRFVIDTVPNGTYALSVQSDAHVPHREDGLELNDRADLEIQLGSGTQISGRVLSSRGEPVSGASLQLRLGDSERRSATTDAEGRYSVGGIQPGKIDEVRIDAAGYSIAFFEDVEVSANSRSGTLELDFEIDASVTIAGIVRDARGEPIPEALVQIGPASTEQSRDRRNWRARRREFLQTVDARTDAKGRFAFSEVNAGSAEIALSISHARYKSFRSEAFEVTPGESIEDLDFVLDEGATVEAWVRNVDGQSTPGVRVRLVREKDGDESSKEESRRSSGERLERTAGPDGRVIFAGIDGGTFTISSRARGFQPFALTIEARDNAVQTVTMELLPENEITGIVRDNSGEPVEGAEIVAYRESKSGRERSEARSDTAGRFRVGSLGDGEYTVRFRRRGFVEKITDGVRVNTDMDLRVDRLARVSGRVLAGLSLQPVRSFEIRYRSVARGAEPSKPRGVKDEEGRFSLDLPSGSYELDVRADGFVRTALKIQVAAGQIREGVEILLPEGFKVAGRVISAETQQPVPGARITLFRAAADGSSEGGRDGSIASSTARPIGRPERSRDDGSFSFPEMDAGSYEIVVRHGSFTTFRRVVDLTADGLQGGLTLELDPGETLRGRISGRSGSLQGSVTIRVRGADGTTRSARTSDSGEYTLSGLVVGTYSVSVSAGQESIASGLEVAVDRGVNEFDYRVDRSGD
ncbi:MAG: carboxypeptidase-like regulatory domain-containing protein [Planctomycetota bacterium]